MLWVMVLFLPKNAYFLQKNADISETKGVLVLKGIFLNSTYVYLRAKFQVSSIILTSFRQGVILLHTAKQTLKKPALLGLTHDNF